VALTFSRHRLSELSITSPKKSDRKEAKESSRVLQPLTKLSSTFPDWRDYSFSARNQCLHDLHPGESRAGVRGIAIYNSILYRNENRNIAAFATRALLSFGRAKCVYPCDTYGGWYARVHAHTSAGSSAAGRYASHTHTPFTHDVHKRAHHATSRPTRLKSQDGADYERDPQ